MTQMVYCVQLKEKNENRRNKLLSELSTVNQNAMDQSREMQSPYNDFLAKGT